MQEILLYFHDNFKKSGISQTAISDQRGGSKIRVKKHINLFLRMSSHFCR